VSAFADTSFLFAFYFPRAVSEQAIARVEASPETPFVSSLVCYEFQQAVWFKVWLQAQGQSLGLSEPAALAVLAAFELDIEQRLWRVAAPDWEGVIARAVRLATSHTSRIGARAMDILHVAVALQLGVDEMLSFDANQRRMAVAEGSVVAPRQE
jgi:predicted nucleic acid-binding protein